MAQGSETPMKLPGWKLAMFALGQLGWSLASWSVSNALTFFFLPPEKAGGGAALFPTFIYQGAIFGALTIIGLINAGGRVWDAVTDPWVANLSDRSHSKLGRRRLFLLIAAIPTAVLAFLVFIPIADGSTASGQTINSIWLAVTMTLYYWFITMYCTPFNALISELGHSPNERLGISTAISVTWALGFALGNQAYAIYPALGQAFGLAPERAFQCTLGAFELLAALLMILPVIFIDERKYAEVHTSDEGVFKAVASTFKNKNFLTFVLSDLPYWVALNFIQMGITYYVITLLGLPESLPSFLMLAMFVLSFAFYLPVNLVAKKLGKKPVLVFAFGLFALDFLFAFFLGRLPLPATAQAWLVVIIAALPMAIFGILPNAIVADVAESHGIETGQYKAGIFFGARTFMMKMGIALANLLFPSLLLLGKSAASPVGIRASALCALGFCLIGMLVFLRYDEKKVIATLAKKERVEA